MFGDEIPYLFYIFALFLLSIFCFYWSISRLIILSQFILNGSQCISATITRENRKGECVLKAQFIDHNNQELNTELKSWTRFSHKNIKSIVLLELICFIALYFSLL